MDLSKLDLPWHADESWLVRLNGGTLRSTPGFAKFEGEHRNEEAAFAAAVSQMVSIMLRRGWGVSHTDRGWKATGGDKLHWQLSEQPRHPDPVTAILEADQWMKENYEKEGKQ